MADLLVEVFELAAGAGQYVRGFVTNVSNYGTTPAETAYANALRTALALPKDALDGLRDTRVAYRAAALRLLVSCVASARSNGSMKAIASSSSSCTRPVPVQSISSASWAGVDTRSTRTPT